MQASIDLVRAGRPARRSAFTATCFAIFTLFLLAGYALFGKGFAYLGIPPYGYVGELGLLLGIMTLCTVLHLGLWRLSVTWLLAAFMLWGLIRTIPYIGTYGIDTLRDAVIWGYGVYAFAVATVVLRFNAFEKVAELYGRALPIFLVLAPAMFALYYFAGDLIPRWPWGPEDGVSIILPKAGDLGAQYAGAFPFLLSGLSGATLGVPLFALWVVGAAPLIAFSRGALVTIASAVGLVMLLRPALKTYYALSIAVVCMLFVFLVMSAGNIGLSDRGRIVSAEQIWQNIESIFSNDVRPDLNLEGTKRWREMWWDKIVDYTFEGEYFWTGKGFGINLADADGFQTDLTDHTLRSPHNVNMTILARSGVPGLLLWAALQLTFALKLLLSFFRDRKANRPRLAAMEFWVLLYWLAFIINGSFDVFLEGPQGGIWFWSIVGFGLALISGHRRLASEGIMRRQALRA
jgi:O-Antigen ligase